MTKKVLGIVGSLREQSLNRALAREAQKRATVFELEVITLEDIPLFSQDLEAEPPLAIEMLRDKTRAADGLWLFSPEYNHSIPGVLKNAIDWLSRKTPQGEELLAGKKIALSGATPGMSGTQLAQDHLVVVLSFLNARVMNLPRLSLPRAGGFVAENGTFDLGESAKYLDRQIEAFNTFLNE